MQNEPKVIENISDTARWVAYYRAMETDRADAHFQDPYAKLLAGPKGEQIATTLKAGKDNSWWLVVRTVVIDQFIQKLVQEKKIDTVLNLAAGLDTRPYRMNLPVDFNWIEVDLPGIMEYKQEKLQSAVPTCRLQQIKLDLSRVEEREKLFQEISKESKSVLVLTEGLLIYLEEPVVVQLAKDMANTPNFNYWIQDFCSKDVLKYVKKMWGGILKAANSEMHFAPSAGAEFFESYGWQVLETRYSLDESRRLNRQMPLGKYFGWLGSFMTKSRKDKYRRFSGYALLQRQNVV